MTTTEQQKKIDSILSANGIVIKDHNPYIYMNLKENNWYDEACYHAEQDIEQDVEDSIYLSGHESSIVLDSDARDYAIEEIATRQLLRVKNDILNMVNLDIAEATGIDGYFEVDSADYIVNTGKDYIMQEFIDAVEYDNNIMEQLNEAFPDSDSDNFLLG